jgi:flagellar basal-body rod protein FlgF
MADGIYTALTGAITQQQSLDVIANNVANASTAGFRADRAVFTEFLAGAQKSQQQTVSQSGAAPVRPDHFVQVAQVTHDYQDGALKMTGNPLDMALTGDGFFVVQGAQGERLTRAGGFMMRADGTLSTPDGQDVLGIDDKPIRLPQDKVIHVADDGTIQADGAVVGKLKLVRAADPKALQKESATTFVAGQGVALENATNVMVTQGHIEHSNVNAVAGLNELITVNRSFDALQRVIETFQKIDDRTARELGGRG